MLCRSTERQSRHTSTASRSRGPSIPDRLARWRLWLQSCSLYAVLDRDARAVERREQGGAAAGGRVRRRHTGEPGAGEGPATRCEQPRRSRRERYRQRVRRRRRRVTDANGRRRRRRGPQATGVETVGGRAPKQDRLLTEEIRWGDARGVPKANEETRPARSVRGGRALNEGEVYILSVRRGATHTP